MAHTHPKNTQVPPPPPGLDPPLKLYEVAYINGPQIWHVDLCLSKLSFIFAVRKGYRSKSRLAFQRLVQIFLFYSLNDATSQFPFITKRLNSIILTLFVEGGDIISLLMIL